MSLTWKRPDTGDYPKVWHTFMARDTDGDNLVEYRIQDLPPDRANDAYEHMLGNYILDEPVAQVLGSAGDLVHFEDYKMAWDPMVAQRMPLVCFKAGSDEIVGVNWLYVCTKEDSYMDKCRAQVSRSTSENSFIFATSLENADNFILYHF